MRQWNNERCIDDVEFRNSTPDYNVTDLGLQRRFSVQLGTAKVLKVDDITVKKREEKHLNYIAQPFIDQLEKNRAGHYLFC